MNNLQELTQDIITWAEDKDLTTASPVKQMYKLIEEFGETAEGITKNRPLDIKDGIGDMFVVKTIMEMQVKNDPNFTPNIRQDMDKKIEINEESFLILLWSLGDMAREMLGRIGYVDIPQSLEEELGDFTRYLSNFADNSNLTLTDCVAQAYNEIKDRKGKMINGVFVKESDLNETLDLEVLGYSYLDEIAKKSNNNGIVLSLKEIENKVGLKIFLDILYEENINYTLKSYEYSDDGSLTIYSTNSLKARVQE